MTTIKISVKELHLAAYLKAKGCKLVNVSADSFVFETDKSETEWRIFHSNSEALLVDRELLTLKQFIKRP
jgi:aspartokinase